MSETKEVAYRFNADPIPAVVLVELGAMVLAKYSDNPQIIGIHRHEMRGEWRYTMYYNVGDATHTVSVKV